MKMNRSCGLPAWRSILLPGWRRERVTVVLTGEGSDETLAGYTRYPWTLLNSRMDSVYRSLTPAVLRRMTARGGSELVLLPPACEAEARTYILGRDGDSWTSFYFDNFYSAFSEAEQEELLTPGAKRMAGDAYGGSMKYWDNSSGDLLHRLLYTDIKTYLVELLMKQDQMSMAASIESRVPFLDHRLVGIHRAHSSEILHEGHGGKVHSEVGRRGSAAQVDCAPQEDGFSHAVGVLAGRGTPVRDLERLLMEPRTSATRALPAPVSEAAFAEHRAGAREHGNRIWRLLNLELWLRVCVDGESPGRRFGPSGERCSAVLIRRASRREPHRCHRKLILPKDEEPCKKGSAAERSAASGWAPAWRECCHSYVPLCHGGSRVSGGLSQERLSIPGKVFRAQMELVARRFRPTSLQQVGTSYERSRRNFPDRAVVVTFDDGYADNYEIAAPVLNELGVPATFYVTVDSVERRRLPWPARFDLPCVILRKECWTDSVRKNLAAV